MAGFKRVGRFQVMAVLQAARAFVLGRSLEEAQSFGLNRAIFYAAAKRGFRPKVRDGSGKRRIRYPVSGGYTRTAEIDESDVLVDRIGDEMAFYTIIDGKKYFIMGEKPQTPEDFKRQIINRFPGNFEKAWEEAIRICESYDRAVLLSQRSFFNLIYKPRRDELAAKWSRG